MADSMSAEEAFLDDPSPVDEVSVTQEEDISEKNGAEEALPESVTPSQEDATLAAVEDLTGSSGQGAHADSEEQISSQNLTLDASLVDALGNLSQEDSQRTIPSSIPNTENSEEVLTQSEDFVSVQDSEQSILTKSPDEENSEEQSQSVPDSEQPETLEDKESQKENEKPQRLTQLPPSRIKSIMKMDPEVGLFSQDSVFLITKATEFFIQAFGKECQVHTLNSKRKTVQKKDIEAAIATTDAFQFLDDVLETFT